MRIAPIVGLVSILILFVSTNPAQANSKKPEQVAAAASSFIFDA